MPICEKCGKQLGLFDGGKYRGKYYHDRCKYEIIDMEREKNIVEIKCPFCNKLFKPRQEKPTTTGGNIARGTVFLPWGMVSAVKNKPFVQCPHCKMKIPQG